VISGRFSARARAWIDVFGTLFFLLPMAIGIMWLAWPVFIDAYTRGEVSTNAGGLIIWPARLMLPVGFLLLVLQGFSELVKRIAFIRGLIRDPAEKYDKEVTAEEELIQAMKRELEEQEKPQ
jgi:TRAP-type mannitol/chloroaromatic compound transport system permease small subunit